MNASLSEENLVEGRRYLRFDLGNLGVGCFEKKLCRQQGLVRIEKILFGLGLSKVTFVRLMVTLTC